MMNKPATIFIFLILAALVLFLFAVPQYRHYQDLRKAGMGKMAQYSGESIYFARISDILSNLQGRKEALEKIESALPAGFSLGPLMDFLYKKGSENGVLITSVVFAESSLGLPEIAPVSAAGQTQDVAFTLDARGSYNGLKNFLLAIDNSARLFETDSIAFSKAPPIPGVRIVRNQPQEYVLKMELRARSY